MDRYKSYLMILCERISSYPAIEVSLNAVNILPARNEVKRYFATINV